MNILFLTASTGGGHIKAAQALMGHMEDRIPRCRTVLVDALKYVNPFVNKLITGSYLQTVRKAPWIYGRLYDLSEKDDMFTDFVRKFNSILAPRLYRIFEKEMPDAVICTHTIPLQMVCQLKKAGYLSTPVIGIVTDYANHYFWKLEEADAFVVAHEYIKSDMVRMGIDKNRIHTYGIPVPAHFADNSSFSESIVNGLNSTLKVLLMGGSLGLCNIKSAFTSLLELRRDIQIMAVTGYNAKLQHDLEKLAEASPKTVQVFGWTDKISELMDYASIIITKPGGVTISEALIKKLPIFFLDPIPGQEERNARFLKEAGAAFALPHTGNFRAVFENVLDMPYLLQFMSDAAGRLAKPDACEDITKLVRGLVSNDQKVCRLSGIRNPVGR